MKVDEKSSVEVIEHRGSSTMTFQNGALSNGYTSDFLTSHSVTKSLQMNGPQHSATDNVSVILNKRSVNGIAATPAVLKSDSETVSSLPTTYLNGPDQVLPATQLSTSLPGDRVKICLEKDGIASKEPISVPGLLHKTAQECPDVPALSYKGEDGQWKNITYKSYEAQVRICAKAFLKLGLKKHHGVCILGFNSPQWFISDLGAIYAGGFAAGIYTTNSAEACCYCAENSRANIIVVEDKKQLDKILAIRHKLPELKTIVLYEGQPNVEGVISWEEMMKIGSEEPDNKLEEVLRSMAANECCTLVYTSGTVGQPKAAMLSHDNLTWNAVSIVEFLDATKAGEHIVSFLPLSHVAAQIMDIYVAIATAATIYFADKDALKGSLVKTLQEVRPTRFLGVPRVWEKIFEKMQHIGSQAGIVKRFIASWAKGHGLQHYLDVMNGNNSNTFSYLVARTLIFSKIKQALGLDRCISCLSGAAPISVDIKKYFMSIDIPVMDAFGMSETAGGHTISTSNSFRLEAVGRKRPGIYTKVINPDEDGQGEICMAGRHIFMGYLNDPEKTSEAMDDEGWLHSGDLGKIDENDYIYITGRIKELIITAGGENIPPVLIEEEVKAQLPCISTAVLIGDKRKFLSILLTFKTEINLETGEPLDELTSAAKEWCKSIGVEADKVTDILDNEKVTEAIQNGIDRANTRAISNAQRIQKFKILPHDFSIHTGEIGPTMKLKRNVVATKYSDIIDQFYQET